MSRHSTSEIGSRLKVTRLSNLSSSRSIEVDGNAGFLEIDGNSRFTEVDGSLGFVEVDSR